jgi:hypothetical protein
MLISLFIGFGKTIVDTEKLGILLIETLSKILNLSLIFKTLHNYEHCLPCHNLASRPGLINKNIGHHG